MAPGFFESAYRHVPEYDISEIRAGLIIQLHWRKIYFPGCSYVILFGVFPEAWTGAQRSQ